MRATALISIAVLTGTTFSAPVQGIRAAVDEPIAPRGGVMLLPLGASQPGNDWPATLDLMLEDGRTLAGTIVWAYPDATRIERRGWTDAVTGLAVRAISPADDTRFPGLGAAFLVAPMPADGTGSVQFGDQTLRPRWRDVPSSVIPGVAVRGAALERRATPDRPDPESPYAYWRWALLGERLERLPPSAGDHGPIGALVAQHFADLWRIGLARVAASSPGVARACLDELTLMCRDPDTGADFAAWTTDPAELSALLTMMLDDRTADDAVVRRVLAWTDARPQLLAWPEAGYGSPLCVAIVNRTVDPIIARLRWQNDIPIAVELAPRSLHPERIERPPSSGDDVGEAALPALTIEADGAMAKIAFGAATLGVRPPALRLPDFRPPLTLAEVESSQQRPMMPTHETAAQLRRVDRRWEIFFDCRRPETAAATGGGNPLGDLREWQSLRGVEAVTVLLGPSDATIAIVIPESGAFRVLGTGAHPDLQVHRRSYLDRWYCRIVLPDAWVESPLYLAAQRTHGDRPSFETSPSTGPAWRPRPARLAVELATWDAFD